MSLCTVSPVLLCRRSSWRPLAFNRRRAGVNQGADVVKDTNLVFNGASKLRKWWRLSL